MKNIIKIILRGFGQVMLQNNALTGLLFLIGIFYNSWVLGIGAVVGGIISTYSAYLLKYSKEDINSGLFGFNGVLVGIAVYFYFGLNITSFIFLILGSFFSTYLMHKMKSKIPAFTAPFIISTWAIIFIIKVMEFIPLLSSSLPDVNYFNLFSSLSMGFGQVMFQNSMITGIIFFIALLVNSKKAALFGLYGSILGSIIALIFAMPISMINIGLFGYNAVLCGIALGNNKNKSFIFATIAIILSVILNFWLGILGVITLTAPFVIASWISIYIKEKKLFLR